ncbi:MAG TPA: T9SS type A sorting domain-containing protein [Flavobacteriales bacterium]
MLRSLPLSLGLLLPSLTLAQVPNGGFETWMDNNGIQDPQGWITLNETGSFFGLELAAQGMPGAVGTSYLELTTGQVEGLGVIPSMAFAGTVTEDDVIDGFPFAQRPEALVGQLKYAPVGEDVASILVALTRWDAGSDSRIAVASGTLFVEDNTADWSSFTIPLDYLDGTMPDTASITILASSGNGAAAGTVFGIDDLQFTGGLTSIDERQGTDPLVLLPNPADQQVQVLARTPLQYIEVLAADGRCVRTLRTNSSHSTLDLTGMAPGGYVVRTMTSDGTWHSKRLLKH